METSSPVVEKNRGDVLGFWKGNLSSNTDNVLAFRNLDSSVVVIVYNDQDIPKEFNIKVGHLNLNPTLESKSFNSILIK